MGVTLFSKNTRLPQELLKTSRKSAIGSKREPRGQQSHLAKILLRFGLPPSMKTNRIIAFVRFALLGTALGLTAACSEKTRADASATAKDIYADTKDAVTSAWDKMKSYSFDKRGDFTTHAKALSAKMEADASALRANYSDTKASASRKAAMAELKNSEADYKEKVAALSHATADTWESAKQNVIASWDRLQAAYYKARTE
jgi:hypothetical protein